MMNKLYFEENDKLLSKYLKAVSHPVRLTILRALMDNCRCPNGNHPCSCGESCEGKNCKCGYKCGTLVEMFDISQSTVSQHIRELKSAGLIDLKTRKGDYTLNHSKLKEMLDLFKDIFEFQLNSYQEENKCKCC